MVDFEKLVVRVSDAYTFHASLGQETHALAYGHVIRDRDNPDVWMSNAVHGATAETPEERTLLFDDVERLFEGYSYRQFIVDPVTPSTLTAALALGGYEEKTAILQAVLLGDFSRPVPDITIAPVTSDKDWEALHALVRIDHEEGERTKGYPMDETITRGIVEAYRKKEGPCQFFLAQVDGTPCAYGSGVNCPDQIGMVEDLFTLPEFRKRGLASAIIKHCIDYVRERGAGPVFIGAHVNDTPKDLYHRLGFEPLFLTRTYFKEL